MPVYSVKTAAGWLDAVKRYSGMAPRAVASLFQHNPNIHPALDMGREIVFGSPISMMRDVRQPGGVKRVLNQMYNPLYKDPVTGKRDLVNSAFSALAATQLGMSAYQAAQAPPEERGTHLGRLATQAVTVPFTSRLGVFGMGPVQRPFDQLGALVGHQFDAPHRTPQFDPRLLAKLPPAQPAVAADPPEPGAATP